MVFWLQCWQNAKEQFWNNVFLLVILQFGSSTRSCFRFVLMYKVKTFWVFSGAMFHLVAHHQHCTHFVQPVIEMNIRSFVHTAAIQFIQTYYAMKVAFRSLIPSHFKWPCTWNSWRWQTPYPLGFSSAATSRVYRRQVPEKMISEVRRGLKWPLVTPSLTSGTRAVAAGASPVSWVTLQFVRARQKRRPGERCLDFSSDSQVLASVFLAQTNMKAVSYQRFTLPLLVW